MNKEGSNKQTNDKHSSINARKDGKINNKNARHSLNNNDGK